MIISAKGLSKTMLCHSERERGIELSLRSLTCVGDDEPHSRSLGPVIPSASEESQSWLFPPTEELSLRSLTEPALSAVDGFGMTSCEWLMGSQLHARNLPINYYCK